MSQVLTVPTHFNDIGELSEGFLDRVEQDTLILYGPVAYEEGSEIEFALLLADGTAALEGVGRVRAAVDGGEDRVPETRYDVVVEALQLDGRSEVVFERLVIARQAVSEAPPAEDDPVVEEVEPGADEVLSLAPDEVLSVAPEDDEPVTVPPEEEAPDTVPPEAYADDEEEDEPATVIAEVDAEAMMAESFADADADADADARADADADTDTRADADTDADTDARADTDADTDTRADAGADAGADADTRADAGADAETISGEEIGYDVEEVAYEYATESEPALPKDSMYAFEHGIAEEPKVGMPVPVPSMAAPPEAPPAPPTLRLAEPPEGLTRPSLGQPQDPLFTVDGEVSDVHTTGLFAYEEGLPIPSRPPLPDPNRAKQVVQVEAANDYDVEESEPPELLADEYEEVRLSDFAEAVEEG
jgi:hypothetical protein